MNILPISIVDLTQQPCGGIIYLLNYIEMEFNMKKGLKIIVPLLLAIALIGCSIWYLFVYDRGFTQDVLLHTARFFDSKGGTTTAQWFYNMAYKLGKDNDAVAIELANQYINDGNYSKAEYTLHNAIADGGGADLYVALSKTYVQQGKLQDALKLIETAPEDIRKDLTSRLPAAPVADRNSGALSDYGPISITADGKLYVNTTGEIPSVRTDIYKGPITLNAGENTLCAIVVAENGLVNQATFTYTVHGVIEPVAFNDPAFEGEIRQMLEIPEGTIYTNQLWDISSFTMPEGAVNYQDLQYLLYLEQLTIHNGQKNQLSILSQRTTLTKLDLTGTPLSAEEVQIIGNLPNLTELVLGNCGITTMAPLANLTKLRVLDLQQNTIMDLSHLSNMTALTELYLNNNAINDISVLENLKELTKLNVSNNNLSVIDPTFKLTKLTHLYAAAQGQDESGGLTSIEGIQSLTELTHLSLATNKLTDITPLSACTKLQELDVSANSISSLEAIKGHNELMFLYFSHNAVEEIPAFDHEASKLSIIDGSYNKISSLEPLADHHLINKVYMDHNEKIESVDCLITCHALILVSVDGTNVKEADILLWYYPDEESAPLPTGIKVIFDPTKEGKN